MDRADRVQAWKHFSYKTFCGLYTVARIAGFLDLLYQILRKAIFVCALRQNGGWKETGGAPSL
jgi:hypothetical protein